MTPRIRQSVYALGTVATGLLALLSLWRVVDPATASTLNAALAGLLSLLGVGAAGTAAVITNKQRHDGTFDIANPADQVASGIEAVLAAQRQAQAEVDRVKDVVTKALPEVPVLGPLSKQILDQLK